MLVNLDDDVSITLSSDMLQMVDEMVEELFSPETTLSLLERWSKQYLRGQIEEPRDKEQSYAFNVLCLFWGRVSGVAGLHPLSVAHKTNFIFTGSSIHLFYLTPLDCEPMCASEGPALQHHLLVFGLDVNALMFLNRSIDEDFMNFVAKNKQVNQSSLFSFNQSASSHAPSEDGSSDSFNSSVVKMNGVSFSVRYRFVHSPNTDETPMKLLPLDSRVGMLRVCSKSSVVNSTVPFVGVEEEKPTQLLKFNMNVEKVNCVTNDEMMMHIVKVLLRDSEIVEEVVLKLKMRSACEKYQFSMLFFMLLQRVGTLGPIYP